MDLERLRFGDWVMGISGVAVLIVLFMDWYQVPSLVLFGDDVDQTVGALGVSAWEAFSVNDLIIALAAVMAIATFVLTATQPTAAVPLALAALTTLVSVVAWILVVLRLIWPPDLLPGPDVDVDRVAGAWLGLVAVGAMTAGCLASLRDEQAPEPDHPVEPRLVEP